MVALTNSRFLRIIPLLIAVWCCSLWAANVEILDQELNVNGQGYTILRVWGSYYEMGFAHASVLGDYIVEAIDQTKAKLGGNYAATRNRIAASVWLPLESEKEIDGMVDCLNTTHPAAAIDKLDLKVFNTLGDWLYACRSHTCWGRYVAAPVKTLSTRRLDFSTALPILNHHVLIAYDPNDATAKWLNLAWPGIVTVAQGINEYGTLVSLHDYQSFPADLSAERMSRLVAARYAITYITSDDISTQLEHVFAELQNYEIMTGGFINYYAPLGFGGVINCSPRAVGPDFYRLRTPQATWHHGEAMVTTNRDTNGIYTPSDEDFGVDAYYNDEAPKTHESHWHLVDPVTDNHGLSRLSVAYRERRDMTVWADGRLDGIGRTPRLEYEWSELFDTSIKYSGGTGEPNDPYRISTLEDLITLGDSPEDYYKHFILTADIDLDPHLPGRRVFDRAVIAPVVNEDWFQETAFAGVFDGDGHNINNLHIHGGIFLGLFGLLGPEGRISHLGLEAVDVNGTDSYIGGLVGKNIRGSITTCYSTGTVTGTRIVGGLVGENDGGAITTSYSTATVTGTVKWVGGLVGNSENYGGIIACYSTGTVTGNTSVGGLVGILEGSITSSYSTASVNGDSGVGGLLGIRDSGVVTNSYSTGAVTGNEDIGGLVGYSAHYWQEATPGSFWDMETSGQVISVGGTGLTTVEMQTTSTFLDTGWDFVDENINGPNDVWKMWDGYDYPRLVWEPGPNTLLVFVDINDPGFYGQMSKYEVTNAQYCDFLNAALASGDITIDGNDVYGAVGSNSGEDYAIQRYYRCDGSGYTGYGATNGGAARIHYSEGTFSVDSGFGNHPVTYVSWYGAMAFANYYGYYLPTEEQWRAVADYDDTYIYGCGQTIDPGIANYRNSEHPDGTTQVGSFGVYGYGMSDMAGNVWEWTSSSLEDNRVFRGGGMGSIESDCDVSIRGDGIPHANYWDIGFRVCR